MLILLGALLLFSRIVLATCSCGYIVNSTMDAQHQVFTDAVETDFQLKDDITWSSQEGYAWQVQEYNVSTAASRGPFGKAAQSGNVLVNNGDHSSVMGDLGVQLWVRSRLISYGSDQLVPMAEIASARNDILFGSFRFTMRTTPVNGTCGAAFFYHNDSQEIDMEILSKQQSAFHGAVQLVVQSPASVRAGFNAANSSSLMDNSLGYPPSMGFTEYRFDWLPDRIDFYTNGSYQWSVYDSIPDTPGQIHLSHWSNGDPNWSAGPPQQDAVLTVSSVKAYFNSSLPDRQAAFTSACASSQDQVCHTDAKAPTHTGPVTSTSSVSAATASSSSGGTSWYTTTRRGMKMTAWVACFELLRWGINYLQ